MSRTVQKTRLAMTVRVITGSKQQIAEQVAKLPGEVREAIVFIDETPTDTPSSGTSPASPKDSGSYATAEAFFAEMESHMVDVGDVDDSREAIYERQEGE